MIPKSSTTIVSCYFDILHKYSKSFYLAHIERFFKNLDEKQPLIFFATDEIIEELRYLRSPEYTLFVSIHVKDFVAFHVHGIDFWQKQTEINPLYTDMETAILSYEKRYFIDRIIRQLNNPFQSNYFIWIDAICIQEDSCNKYLKTLGKESKMKEIIKPGKIMIPQITADFSWEDVQDGLGKESGDGINQYPLYDFSKISSNFTYLNSAIIAGDQEAWSNYTKNYFDAIHPYYYQNKCFIMEQNVIATAMKIKPDEFDLVLVPQEKNPIEYMLEYL